MLLPVLQCLFLSCCHRQEGHEMLPQRHMGVICLDACEFECHWLLLLNDAVVFIKINDLAGCVCFVALALCGDDGVQVGCVDCPRGELSRPAPAPSMRLPGHFTAVDAKICQQEAAARGSPPTAKDGCEPQCAPAPGTRPLSPDRDHSWRPLGAAASCLGRTRPVCECCPCPGGFRICRCVAMSSTAREVFSVASHYARPLHQDAFRKCHDCCPFGR